MASKKEAVPEVMSDKSLAKAGQEVDVQEDVFDDLQLSEIKTFEDAIRAVEGVFGEVTDAAEELGTGFAVLPTDDKSKLVGIPLIFVQWRFNTGDNGEFVSATAVAQTAPGVSARYIINDGSTGIRDQLKAYTEKTGKTGGLAARRGLRVSNYDYEDPKTGEVKRAKTYYVDTSA